MTIGSFVCTRCSGVLRGLTPPHRVKSISMATFTQEEIDFLRSHGNELCAKTWLGLWDPKRAAHQQQQDQRELITDKYERKRYYLEPASPLKSLNLKAAAPVNLHSHNGHHHNGVTVSTLSSNGYASIHLTPPAAQRTTANGLHKGTPVSSSSATSTSISRPQHHHHSNNSNNNNNNGHQATDAFGSALINNNPNPFKSQQQQQQMLSNHVVNPFQQQQQQQQNLYGQLTLIPNAYGSSPQQQQQQQTNFFNFNNNGYAMGQGLPNGCGFGSMQPAPVMANNPFAASGAMNTNNPFL
ncbi:arf-GAP domain and FG repeat-containing protein 1 isoform X6 [Drosophila subobscura]|uniref:arf-GAP domain and FG repeat-containing protein 1 isoform X6 n=1 Tax=Drosophila subobscura TaxID=7241 RepID=UPI00155AD9B6|nr:arf-GAP domain and FG repeat-containing protein 1 isoform X6 [Drosophila subobscura]